jgi:hypothetical protein
MDLALTVGIWQCAQGGGPEVVAVVGYGGAAPPDFRGTVVEERGDRLIVRVEGSAPPRAGPETVYRIEWHGLYVESGRDECPSIRRGQRHVLLTMIAL